MLDETDSSIDLEWEEGYQAAMHFEPLSENPYKDGSGNFAQWEEGWHAARESEQFRIEARSNRRYYEQLEVELAALKARRCDGCKYYCEGTEYHPPSQCRLFSTDGDTNPENPDHTGYGKKMVWGWGEHIAAYFKRAGAMPIATGGDIGSGFCVPPGFHCKYWEAKE